MFVLKLGLLNMRVFSSLYNTVFRSFTKRSVQMKIDLNEMDNNNFVDLTVTSLNKILSSES